MNSEVINILCATDENYAPYCGIMLTSLFESNKDSHFIVYIFQDGSVTEVNVRKYERLAKKYGNEIVLKTIDESMVKEFPINKNTHITIPTYYRLLAADLLPKDVHKVIYLDCDVIVVGDIKPLWEVSLDDMALAGAMDCGPSFDNICNRLGYPVSFGYINAGVLVFNLDYWREKGLTERIFAFINEKIHNLTWMDQDALNGVLYKEKLVLPVRYNFSIMFFYRYYWEKYLLERQQSYFEECGNIVIIHYQGKIKPWDFRHYKGAFYYNWKKNNKKSPWKNCEKIKPWTLHVMHRMKRYIYPPFFKGRVSQWVVLPENRKCYKECII